MKKRFLAALSLMGWFLVGGSAIVGWNNETKLEPIIESYTISTGSVGIGGTLSVDKTSAKEGDIVTITVTLDNNKKIG